MRKCEKKVILVILIVATNFLKMLSILISMFGPGV
jgi:hypothetical protein